MENQPKREIIITADGSKTIQFPELKEQYHSVHGAINEANHVFIKNGFHYLQERFLIKKPVKVLEMGFGTGLNAFLTLLESKKSKIKVNYVGVEAYPITISEMSQLNYANLVNANAQDVFEKMHDIPWEQSVKITPNFTLQKRKRFFNQIEDRRIFDLIYFDAFGARVQPESWTIAIFSKMFKAIKDQGVLVTYSAKGSVRRAMHKVGFKVERLHGPPGKREMLRATKDIKDSQKLW